MRLIDADTVVTIQVYNDMTEEYGTKRVTIADAIDEWSDEGCPPFVDVPERKVGKWEESRENAPRPYMCSRCGSLYDVDKVMGQLCWRFCPNCGAAMDGEEEGEVVDDGR